MPDLERTTVLNPDFKKPKWPTARNHGLKFKIIYRQKLRPFVRQVPGVIEKYLSECSPPKCRTLILNSMAEIAGGRIRCKARVVRWISFIRDIGIQLGCSEFRFQLGAAGG